jgi:hypothetical protein
MREEDCKWDSDDKLIYKGVKLYIPRESLNQLQKQLQFSNDEVSHFVESQYLITLRYKRELVLKKLGL